MPSRSEGRRTFVGLTVHGRTEGRLESHLQSSPAEGITVTKAEVKPRGDLVGAANWKGRAHIFFYARLYACGQARVILVYCLQK